MQSACVLTSGGVESAVLVADALTRYGAVFPVYVESGLLWETAEKFRLNKFLKSLSSPNLKPLKVLRLPIGDVYGTHWGVTGIGVPGPHSRDEAVYLPGRNVFLTAKAALWAARVGASWIEIGVLKGNPFPDSTPFFFEKMSKTLSLAFARPIVIRTPLRGFTKPQVVKKAKKMGLDLDLTFSCIHPKRYNPCGKCNKCAERKKAF